VKMHTTILEWRAEVAIRTFLRGDQLYTMESMQHHVIFAISDLENRQKCYRFTWGMKNTSGPEEPFDYQQGRRLKSQGDVFLICLLYHAYDENHPTLVSQSVFSRDFTKRRCGRDINRTFRGPNPSMSSSASRPTFSGPLCRARGDPCQMP